MPPSSPDPAGPRYTSAPLPPYRFLPGSTPHPYKHPLGHAYRLPALPPTPLDPRYVARSTLYLRGIDLYNFAYYWESHEAFEALWHGAGRTGSLARFFQALIQLAAAHLKERMGAPAAARSLAARGLDKLSGAPSPFLGLDVRAFERDVAAYFHGDRAFPALLTLDQASASIEDTGKPDHLGNPSTKSRIRAP